MFNSGGLITRGFGDDQRIITRGFSKKIDLDRGWFFVRKYKEYFFNIHAPIVKTNEYDVKIYCPVEIVQNKMINLKSQIYKDITRKVNMSAYLNNEKLFEILNNI